MAGQLGAPEESDPVPRLLRRSARMPVGRDGVAVTLLRGRPVTCGQLEQREMPAQVSVKGALARIGGEPRGEELAAVVRSVALVAHVRHRVRAVRVSAVELDRPLDLLPRLPDTAVFAERERVIGEKPVIVAVMRCETV